MRSLGLRAQIVLALIGLTVLAFVPLYFAMAQLTRVSLQNTRDSAARALGRAVAGHAAELPSDDPAALARTLDAEVGGGGVDAICVFGSGGIRLACAGDPLEVAQLGAAPPTTQEAAVEGRGAKGPVLDVVVPRAKGGAAVARLRTDVTDRAAPLVRLFAGYMAAFAIALAFLAYVVLTRLIVRPLESVGRAADRVASGAKQLDVPRGGAREIGELGDSVRAMAVRLRADEAALRKKVDELEAATKRLTEAQSHLVRSERLASVGRLAAGLAHEIGNPIAAIMGFEEILLEGGQTPEEQKDFLRRMKNETERINKVLRDLLDFARPEAEAPISSSVVLSASVADVAQDVVALLKPQKTMKSVTINVDASADHKVRIAPSRLVQVLLNLGMNAGDAMDDKQGTLRFESKADGDFIAVSVRDTGPGISSLVKDRLFEPFVTTKEPGQGTGLGLAVCRGIIESAGGTINIDPDYKEGTRFVVRLPKA